MGTQQSRSGHGRQGSQQQGQQSDRRPQQDRDLQRNKQSDRSQQQHQQGDREHGSQQGSSPSQSASRSDAQNATSDQQGQGMERQQSQLGGHKDFAHRMENEGREQNQEQQDVRRQQSQQGGAQNVYGEGNYAATKHYDDATKRYVESGRVEAAARDAAPKSAKEAREMDAAEAEGKRHAKGEDPALNRRGTQPSGESSKTPRPGHEEE